LLLASGNRTVTFAGALAGTYLARGSGMDTRKITSKTRNAFKKLKKAFGGRVRYVWDTDGALYAAWAR
jgi:hypothetical protein